MAATPTYTVTQNSQNYATFIDSFRRTLAAPNRYAQGCPVLIEQNDARPNNLFEIILKTGDSEGAATLRLSIRRDNLYFIGFRDETTAGNFGPWYEINSDRRRINNSQPTGVEGDYGALEKAAGIGPKTRLALGLGQKPLTNAVNQLAKVRNPATNVNRTPTSTSVLVTIQMICESIRIKWITEYICEKWTAKEIDSKKQAKMIDFETSWRALSDALIHADQDPDPQHFRLPRPNDMEITNVGGARLAMGIALWHEIPPPPPRNEAASNVDITAEAEAPEEVEALEEVEGLAEGEAPADDEPPSEVEVPADEAPADGESIAEVGVEGEAKAKSEAAVAGSWDKYPKGRALVEVFWVRIDKIHNTNPGAVYGTIKADAAMGSLDLYNRPKTNTESVRTGGYVTLTGPSRSILATDNVNIKLDLWHKETGRATDDSIVQQTVLWKVADSRYPSDRTITQQVTGTTGSGTMYYMICSNGAQALIEVTLVNGNNKNPANLFGTITANNGYGDTVVFDKDAKNTVAVKPKTLIPIGRPAVAVPMVKKLQIKAKMYNRNNPSSDDEVANGTVSFDVDLMKSATKSIRGKNGEISVKVSWS